VARSVAAATDRPTRRRPASGKGRAPSSFYSLGATPSATLDRACQGRSRGTAGPAECRRVSARRSSTDGLERPRAGPGWPPVLCRRAARRRGGGRCREWLRADARRHAASARLWRLGPTLRHIEAVGPAGRCRLPAATVNFVLVGLKGTRHRSGATSRFVTGPPDQNCRRPPCDWRDFVYSCRSHLMHGHGWGREPSRILCPEGGKRASGRSANR
jgi:hypothetical protein